MADKPWKAFERYVAAQLDARRVPALGRQDTDIASERNLWIDAKLRAEVPKAYFTLMGSAEALGYSVVTLNGKLYGLMRLTTFAQLITQQREDGRQNWPVAALSLFPAKGTEWLAHIASSAPEDHLALVAMCRPRMPYRQALVLTHYADFISYLGGEIVRSARANHAATTGT